MHILHIVCVSNMTHFFIVSLLNIHDDERQKPENWVPVGWIPIFDDKKTKGLRPARGYESNPARKYRLYHECWKAFLGKWSEATGKTHDLVWAGTSRRQTRFFIGGLLGDQQVKYVLILHILNIFIIYKHILHILIILHILTCLVQECDYLTCECPPACHRCTASRHDFLSTGFFRAKTTSKRKSEISRVARGGAAEPRGLMHGWKPVVTWNADGSDVRPGPAAKRYEKDRKHCGAHILFNAFWSIPHFCVHQMLMRDPMHQIDLGVILHLLRAILRKFEEVVEDVIRKPGLAAAKLSTRIRLMLKKTDGQDGQR